MAVAAFVILCIREADWKFALAFFAVSMLILAWFVRAWSHEFVFLMGLRDDGLPGQA